MNLCSIQCSNLCLSHAVAPKQARSIIFKRPLSAGNKQQCAVGLVVVSCSVSCRHYPSTSPTAQTGSLGSPKEQQTAKHQTKPFYHMSLRTVELLQSSFVLTASLKAVGWNKKCPRRCQNVKKWYFHHWLLPPLAINGER